MIKRKEEDKMGVLDKERQDYCKKKKKALNRG